MTGADRVGVGLIAAAVLILALMGALAWLSQTGHITRISPSPVSEEANT